MSRAGNLRRGLITLGKVLVSGGLIAFVLSRISLTEIRDAMVSPHWEWLGLALLVYGLSAVGGAFQWAWILRAAGIRAPGREIRRLYFIGLFFNNFLPANVGGDVYKIVDLGRREKRSLGVLSATILDRLIGLGALSCLAVVALSAAAATGIPLPAIALVMVPITLVIAAVLALLISRRLGRLLPGVFQRLGWASMARRMEELAGEFARFRTQIPWLNRVFLFSLLVQFLRLMTHLLVARGLGLVLDTTQMVQLMVLIPMLAVSLTLPVTINGIGLRESVSVNLLTWAGLAATQAVAMELGAYLVQVVFSLQGGLLLWMGRWGRKNEDSQALDA